MKAIDTDGIGYISPVFGTSGDWYFGIDHEQGDLYEAEELFRKGYTVRGRKLCLVHYPDGTVYHPIPKTEGRYCTEPVSYENGICFAEVDFPKGLIRIMRFDCISHDIGIVAEIPLSSVKDCYNLSLQIAPLTLTRQCVADNEFEIVWPERTHFPIEDHDSFFLRDGDRLFFNRWHEEGEGADYRYWEETIVRDLAGKTEDTLPGDVMLMPDGELWHLK